MQSILTPIHIGIEEVYQSIHRNDYEICGTADKLYGKWMLYMTGQGESKQGRNPAECNTKQNYNVVWHTHPHVSKIYPSLADILKVLKHNTHTSFIFTKYGLWKLTCPNKYEWLRDENYRALISGDIEPVLDNFYYRTNNGKEISIDAVKYFTTMMNTGINTGYGIEDFSVEWMGMSGLDYFN